jgi:hypothetical protein
VAVLLKPQLRLLLETIMDKYIGFDVDSKKTVACVVQKGEKDKYTSNGVLSAGLKKICIYQAV